MGVQNHVVFIPKYRRKTLYRELRQELGTIFHKLAGQQESCIEEGHLMVGHVHRLISIPPKYSVAQVVGYLKGKSAIAIARTYLGRRRNFTGQNFWRGAILFRRLGEMKRLCGSIFGNRSRKMSD